MMFDLSKKEIIDSLDDELIVDWGVSAIKAPHIWDKTMGEDVTIVTMDTGIDESHPDLKHSIVSKFNMTNKSLDVSDVFGHGTHVAGLLVGKATGVAPKASLHVIKVLNDEGKGTIANVMDGITYAMSVKADVLSISLGVAYFLPQSVQQRIIQAYESGVTIVSAVGNSGLTEPFYPAIMKEVIGVGGLDKNMTLTPFTNMGYDVLAPSVDILSTYTDGKYARLTGTSMASPLVAGSVALLISYYRKQGKELSPLEIKNMISGKLDLTKLIK